MRVKVLDEVFVEGVVRLAVKEKLVADDSTG